jgi:hypothetical protein
MMDAVLDRSNVIRGFESRSAQAFFFFAFSLIMKGRTHGSDRNGNLEMPI